MESPNRVELLSRADSLAIYRCPNGCLHVQVGTVTLNLTTDQFWALTTCLGEASVRLAVRDVVDRAVAGDPPAIDGR
jgi:hypothetical protein